jgi:hypothetical protein
LRSPFAKNKTPILLTMHPDPNGCKTV